MRGGRWNTVGVPTEKSENFRDVARRLARLLSAQGPVVPLTLVMAVVSVALVVSGPRILGHATNILTEPLIRYRDPSRVDFGALHATLWVAVGVYAASYVLAYGQAWLIAGVVQRTMNGLRSEVRRRSTACPSRTSTATPAATCSAGSRTTSTTSARASSSRSAS